MFSRRFALVIRPMCSPDEVDGSACKCLRCVSIRHYTLRANSVLFGNRDYVGGLLELIYTENEIMGVGKNGFFGEIENCSILHYLILGNTHHVVFHKIYTAVPTRHM